MRIFRGILHDLYVEDGRAAVMVGEQVIVLSELATSIVLAVPESGATTLGSLSETLVEQYGHPQTPHDATMLAREQVLELAAHDILVIDDDSIRATECNANEYEVLLAVHSALGAAMYSTEQRWTLPPEITEEQFLATIERQRVGSQLCSGLHRVELPDLLTARLRAQKEAAAAACSALAADTHRALDALTAQGIDALVFKGMALAAQAWGDETARGYGDVDLIVSPSDVGAAIGCLEESGWQRQRSCPSPGPSWAWRQFVRQDYELTMWSKQTALDLHWHLTPYRSTTPTFEELWPRRVTVEIGGRPVPTLGAYDALAHSASHSAKDHWRWLRGVADVYRLAADPDTWLDADRPLRADELVTLGLSARLFGVPAGVPDVVGESTASAAVARDEAIRRQLGPAHTPEHTRLPGVQLRASLQTLWLTDSSVRDYGRRLSRSIMPGWVLATEDSASGWVAAPRVLWRRFGELIRRVRAMTPA